MNSGFLKKYKLVMIILLLDLLLLVISPEIGKLSFKNSFIFSLEVLKILPPVLILIGLLDMWVPREKIESHLGSGSGMKGSVLALLLGSAAAGPIFAAFPLALSLSNKGVRTANVAIFLGSWATIKIPMLVMESSFLGVRFAMLRLLITAPFIFLIGYLLEKFSPLKKA